MALMTMCGSETITRDEIKNLPIAKATKTHHPVDNSRLVDLTHQALELNKFTIVDEAYAAKPDGSQFFGLLGLECKRDEAFNYTLGIRNCSDKKFRLNYVHGTDCMICDNLEISGEFIVARKHTSKINDELLGLVFNAVSKLGDIFEAKFDRIDKYKTIDLDSQLHQNDLTVRLADSGAITYQQIPKVLDEYRNPRHDEFKDKNLFSYMQAVTETSKAKVENRGVNHLNTFSRRSQIMHDMFAKEWQAELN
tara:strand:+ start:1058 stop:1810 length:753 start_codon:yes stop_codon:yes gene_type:complete